MGAPRVSTTVTSTSVVDEPAVKPVLGVKLMQEFGPTVCVASVMLLLAESLPGFESTGGRIWAELLIGPAAAPAATATLKVTASLPFTAMVTLPLVEHCTCPAAGVFGVHVQPAVAPPLNV